MCGGKVQNRVVNKVIGTVNTLPCKLETLITYSSSVSQDHVGRGIRTVGRDQQKSGVITLAGDWSRKVVVNDLVLSKL